MTGSAFVPRRGVPLLVLALLFLLPAPRGRAQPQANVLALPAEQDLKVSLDQPLPPPAAVQPPSAAEFRQRAYAVAKRYDTTEYDPRLRAALLKPGLDEPFRLVRDELRYESYPGVLRGGRGAYAARAANAADRSLLLAGMLNQQGFKTRFATGRLPGEQADALYARMFDPDKRARPDKADAPSPTAAAFMRRVADRARRDYAAVRAALGADLTGGPTPKDQVLAEIASHVWVQAEVDGQWVDLDPSFADAEPGKAYCEAAATNAALPDDLYQQVTVRVIVERLEGETLSREVPLELTRRVCDVADRTVFLIHTPEADLGPGGVAGFGAAILGGGGGESAGDGWAPTLWVAGEPNIGKPVAFNDGAQPAKRVPRRGAGGFGGALGGDAGEPPAGAGPQVVAEYLELELSIPGGRKETTRRVLFDRAGAAWRKAEAPDPKALRPLARNTRGPLPPQAVHNLWFSAGGQDMAAYGAQVKALGDAVRGAPAKAPAQGGAAAPSPAAADGQSFTLSQQLWMIGLQNQPVVAMGDQVLVGSLNDDPSLRFYLDGPRVLLFSLIPDAGAKADESMVESQIDLRRDKVRGVAREPGESSASAIARRKLWYGMLGGATEHELAAEQQAALVAESGGKTAAAPATASTSALLDDRGLVVLRPGREGDQSPPELAQDPDTAMLMAEALAGGEALVVPKSVLDERKDASGFWAVSLATGDTRAVWGPGGHMANMRSPLRHPGPQTYNPRAWVIDEKTLNSHREGGGNEYGMVVYDTAIRTITVLELLHIIGAAIPWLILAYRLWW